MNRQSMEVFPAVKLLYDTIMMDPCHDTFVQATECTTQMVNPNANYGALMIMMYPCRLISCSNCAPQVQDVSNGRGYACVVAKDVWEISAAFSQFCCEPKFLWKNSLQKIY